MLARGPTCALRRLGLLGPAFRLGALGRRSVSVLVASNDSLQVGRCYTVGACTGATPGGGAGDGAGVDLFGSAPSLASKRAKAACNARSAALGLQAAGGSAPEWRPPRPAQI